MNDTMPKIFVNLLLNKLHFRNVKMCTTGTDAASVNK